MVPWEKRLAAVLFPNFMLPQHFFAMRAAAAIGADAEVVAVAAPEPSSLTSGRLAAADKPACLASEALLPCLPLVLLHLPLLPCLTLLLSAMLLPRFMRQLLLIPLPLPRLACFGLVRRLLEPPLRVLRLGSKQVFSSVQLARLSAHTNSAGKPQRIGSLKNLQRGPLCL
jgi:hypothetical protein